MFDASAPPQLGSSNYMGDIGRKIRAIEDQLNAISERSVFTADSLTKQVKEVEEVVNAIARTVSGLQKDITVLKTEIAQMRKEISKAATVAKVRELEGYINLIDPMKFVTRDEVRRMIQEETRNRG
jgi:septal ring factor EnvC (AmiA/AmiB activator)